LALERASAGLEMFSISLISAPATKMFFFGTGDQEQLNVITIL
jgi:hypothetical protein